MAEEVKMDPAIMALMELGRRTKTIDIKGIEITIRPISCQNEREIADHVGQMEQRGVPNDTTQRVYMKMIALMGVVSPKIDELILDGLPYPTVGDIGKAILEFSDNLEKN